MACSQLYTQVNYKAPIDYIVSSYIREYDISKANINVLLYKGVINQDTYNFLYNLDRDSRQRTVGLMIRDNKEVGKLLQDGIIEMKKNLFEANDIQDYEVLSIKNDAVFLINKIPSITCFHNIEFVNKGLYTSYYKLFNSMEVFYFYDPINNEERCTVKGINALRLELHKKYFLDFLLTVFSTAQLEPVEEVIKLIQIFEKQYMSRELEVQYYREFNPQSLYSIVGQFGIFAKFKSNDFSNKNKNILDIMYNEAIIQHLYKIYSSVYFSNNKK